jgi:hypothetical protein
LGSATRRSNDSISSIDRKFINADRYNRFSRTVDALKCDSLNSTIFDIAPNPGQLSAIRVAEARRCGLTPIKILKALRVSIKVLINLNADSLISYNVRGRCHNDCGDGSKQRHCNCDLPA